MSKQRIHQYTAIFEKNELGGYTVTVPALPGLVTQGRNLDQARLMAEDAIKCHLGGLLKARQSIPTESETGSFRLEVKI